MTYIDNGGTFVIERDESRENPGHPYDFTLRIETNDNQRVILDGLGKGDLIEFRKRINQAIKETK